MYAFIEKVLLKIKGFMSNHKMLQRIAKLIYKTLSNPTVQLITNSVLPTVIGIFAFQDKTPLNLPFLIPGLISLVLLNVLFGVCNVNRTIRNNSMKPYEKSSDFIIRIFGVKAIENLENVKDFKVKIESPFQNKAFVHICSQICNNVRDAMRTIFNNKDFKVCIYGKNRNGCKVIATDAYSSIDRLLDKYTETPLLLKPFVDNYSENVIYIGKEVEREYVDFREDNPTFLHIGIPITVNSKVVMVLQITSHDDIFKSKTTIEDIVNHTLSIFKSYLMYEYCTFLK